MQKSTRRSICNIRRINFYLNFAYLFIKICNQKRIFVPRMNIKKEKINLISNIYIVNETTLKHKSPKTFPIQLYNTASCTTRNEFTLNNQRTRFVDWNRVGGTESINVFTGKITRIFVSFSQRRQRERCNKKKK